MIDYEIRIEPHPKPLRLTFNGALIAATTRALVLHETRMRPRLYIPWSDVRTQFLAKTDHRTHCPFKGDASYWSVEVDGERADNAAWAYEQPSADVAVLQGYVSFFPARCATNTTGNSASTRRTSTVRTPIRSPAGYCGKHRKRPRRIASSSSSASACCRTAYPSRG
jgi:uncharacterized protein (DUF427 family)